MSFASALAFKAFPEAYLDLSNRGNETEYISFPSREFRVLEPEDLAADPSVADGRIVLLGAMTQYSDFHPTPIDAAMPGVLIHAYSLATILQHDYFTEPSTFVIGLIAALLSALLIFFSMCIPGGVKGLVLRLLQLALLLVIIRVGYWLFITHHILLDISYTVLMVTFSFFASDIWTGCATIGEWGKKLWHRRKSPTKSVILNEN